MLNKAIQRAHLYTGGAVRRFSVGSNVAFLTPLPTIKQNGNVVRVLPCRSSLTSTARVRDIIRKIEQTHAETKRRGGREEKLKRWTRHCVCVNVTYRTVEGRKRPSSMPRPHCGGFRAAAKARRYIQKRATLRIGYWPNSIGYSHELMSRIRSILNDSDSQWSRLTAKKKIKLNQTRTLSFDNNGYLDCFVWVYRDGLESA